MAAYYLLNMILYRVLPAIQMEGTVLSSGGRLQYRFNSMCCHKHSHPRSSQDANIPR